MHPHTPCRWNTRSRRRRSRPTPKQAQGRAWEDRKTTQHHGFVYLLRVFFPHTIHYQNNTATTITHTLCALHRLQTPPNARQPLKQRATFQAPLPAAPLASFQSTRGRDELNKDLNAKQQSANGKNRKREQHKNVVTHLCDSTPEAAARRWLPSWIVARVAETTVHQVVVPPLGRSGGECLV